MSKPESQPSRERDLISFRCYHGDYGIASEGRRRGLDPAHVQMKDLYKMMAEAVPMNEGMIEVVMTVRPVCE